ncbi:hypothetical protein SAMN04487935_1064 [Flavobacterium noncentrifugens]|uniref:Uncharacterized protein n=1 Tax=Flavobacterium noncentrifugens TaxID=1128970 RepID=A0A1G8UV93_9FLAO|nr:hypothetical protein SAMN04487935_1064 [Flavobacterium noncentrifugens]
MKYIWFIFTIYLFLLSVYPCIDDVDCNSVDITEVKTTKHSNRDSAIEHCTPFCSCSRCPASAYFVFPAVPTFEGKVNTNHDHVIIDNYTSIYAQNFALEIWQPPRV